MTIAVGSNLGQYSILGQLGEGGMAVVYRAWQPSLGRDVAIKVVRAHLAGQPAFRARFRREAEAQARLEHPNILPVYGFGEEDGQAYIVYRYVAGGTLRDRLRGPWPLAGVVRLLEPVADALDFAHSQGVVHRDIKPGNILLTERLVPIVADFGLARLPAAAVYGEAGEAGAATNSTNLSGPLTQAEMGLGTAAYMAPEQVQGLAVDGQVDQYALGIVAHQLLTGAVPYAAETPYAVALKHVTEPLPLPRHRNPALAEAVEEALFTALAKNPADRFADCSAFVRALDDAQHSPIPGPMPAPVPQVETRPISVARMAPGQTKAILPWPEAGIDGAAKPEVAEWDRPEPTPATGTETPQPTQPETAAEPRPASAVGTEPEPSAAVQADLAPTEFDARRTPPEIAPTEPESAIAPPATPPSAPAPKPAGATVPEEEGHPTPGSCCGNVGRGARSRSTTRCA